MTYDVNTTANLCGACGAEWRTVHLCPIRTTNLQQPPLFGAPIERGTHRHSDKPTSVAAAKSVTPGPDQQRCLQALRLNGGTGTIDHVCDWFEELDIRRDRGALSRRLTDLAQGGYIVDTGETELGSRGRYVSVWRVAS